jgi:DNA modification methylase
LTFATGIPDLQAQIVMRPVGALRPYARNARTHSAKQIRQIADSIGQFGFVNPILVDGAGEIIAGHGRLAAAQLLGLHEVPVLPVTHLTPAQKRAYVLADNKLAEKAGWDREILAIELQGLIDLDFNLEIIGFELAEIDLILDEDRVRTSDSAPDAADMVPALPAGPAITQPGDLWQLGAHRLICGDARDATAIERLLGGDRVDLIFTDPPYNVAIDGHVGGLGRVRHREFAMATGEMSEAAFTAFLRDALLPAVPHCQAGAIAFVCMDWRHMREMLAAGDAVFHEMKNLCVWNKTNGGMGSFYRSKHELVFVWKVAAGVHVNSFGLGETGRYRTNVWDYAGANTFSASRDSDLAMHPTVKPVALVGDAIRDCSRRGNVVLDMFGGSGSTLIAADLAGRRARLVEYDPAYCDTIIARWEALTGKQAVHLETGLGREDLASLRQGETTDET